MVPDAYATKTQLRTLQRRVKAVARCDPRI
jgi:hypothetical protein